MRYFLILSVLVCTVLTTACSSTISNLKPFKLEIQQGNVVTSKMLLQLRPGMTKSQVRYIMGTPLIIDSFHVNRWDYIFQLRQAGKITEQKRVVLMFENELLKSVRGDVMPAGAEAGSGVVKLTPAAEKAAPKTKDARDNAGESFVDKLKFWKSKPAIDVDKKPEADAAAKPPTSSMPDTVTPVPAIIIDQAADGSAEASAPLVNQPVSAEPAAPNQAPVQEPLVTAPSIGPASEPVIEPAPKVKSQQAPVPAKSAPLPIPATKASDAPLTDHALKLDRKLDSNHPSKETSPSEAPASAAKPDNPIESDEAPGYFERMLEKIGF